MQALTWDGKTEDERGEGNFDKMGNTSVEKLSDLLSFYNMIGQTLVVD